MELRAVDVDPEPEIAGIEPTRGLNHFVGPNHPVALELLAVAALLVASGDGDIVAGNSPRRHVAWLGLPLAVAGLWLGLARADATVIEFYTLPVAALLLAILGITLARRPASGELNEPSR